MQGVLVMGEPITDYERAKLRLRAYRLLMGMGSYHKNAEKIEDRFVPWTIERTKSEAESLADWAMDDGDKLQAG